MKSHDPKPGRLYVVATPIGNPDDITLRALAVLAGVDLVASEDTREAGLLLAAHRLQKKLVSCHEHNEDRRAGPLVNALQNGLSIALISDAGTPLISDPGFRLITAALAQGIEVIPIPGVSAAMAALSVAGLPTDSFVFVGFVAKKAARRRAQLQGLSQERRTMIFFVSPRQVLDLLTDIREVMGNRQVLLAREMTKVYEEYLRGDIVTVLGDLTARSAVKGECTLVVAGAPASKGDGLAEAALQDLATAMVEAKLPLGELVRQVARDHRLGRREVYAAALALKKQIQSPPDG